MTFMSTMELGARGRREETRKSAWCQGPGKRYRWIPIEHESNTTAVPVRTGAARPAAGRAALHPQGEAGTNAAEKAA